VEDGKQKRQVGGEGGRGDVTDERFKSNRKRQKKGGGGRGKKIG